MTLLLGTQFYAGGPDANRRQAAAAASLLALRDVDLVNVQWRDDTFDYPGIDALPALERDGRAVAGGGGPRKPILTDVFDALADEAARRGLRRFAFANSDILVLQTAIEAVAREDLETLAFARMDFDRDSGRDLGILTPGLDMFVMDVGWWRAERRRFRPYVLGEWCYDNVFGAIMMTFGRGAIFNREGEIRHEAHAHAPNLATPAARFNYYLSALDSRLFTLWARYHWHLEALRARNASAAEERALIAREFVWRPSVAAAVWHAGRCVRARWRYARDRRAISRAAAAPR